MVENRSSSLSCDPCRYPVTVPFIEKTVINLISNYLSTSVKNPLRRNRITMGLVWILVCTFKSVSVHLWEVRVGGGTRGHVHE